MYYRDDAEGNELHEMHGSITSLEDNVFQIDTDKYHTDSTISVTSYESMCLVKFGPSEEKRYEYMVFAETTGKNACRSYHAFARNTDEFNRRYFDDVSEFMKSMCTCAMFSHLLICMILTHVSSLSYNDQFCSQFLTCENCAGRHHDSEFTECVWCPTWNSCVSVDVKCRTGYKEHVDCPLLSPVELQGERTDGYVAIDHTNQAIIASFSSVASGNRLFYTHFNAEFFTNRQAQFEGSDGLVNRFLYDSWFKLWYLLGMERTLQAVVENNTDFEVWFIGHSLGGAKAEMSVVSVLLKKLVPQDKVRLLTFGATRVGDMSFVNLIEALGKIIL
ncbi:triacylglycerol lipase [Teladorsagia circumcincta]|uniref:Triacylglycerol lipase n=1 Tax=Teladorsagia circumcincta TaxID=45464 RepID=A0A2G9UGH4_TELCI|nr:triacylglycerol lipase [Teladorsagia circumcincta]